MKKRKLSNSKPKQKVIEKICKNCLLYDPKKAVCRATILMEGERINLPMYPTDPCFFEDEITIKDENGKILDRFTPEVQQVKWWVEDPKTGQKSNKGIVKIEFPNNFFGKENEDFI